MAGSSDTHWLDIGHDKDVVPQGKILKILMRRPS